MNVGLFYTDLACLWWFKLVNNSQRYVSFVSIPFDVYAVEFSKIRILLHKLRKKLQEG